jgi:hypothetical protein
LAGEWDELLAMANDAPTLEEEPAVRGGIEGIAFSAILAAIQRGLIDDAVRLSGMWDDHDDSSDVQTRSFYGVVRAAVANATGDHLAALGHARHVFELAGSVSRRHSAIKFVYVEAVEAGLAAGDIEACGWFLSTVEGWSPGSVTPFMRATTDRFRARLEPTSDETEGRLKRAAGLFRELGTPFYLACTLFEHGAWLVASARARDAEPLLAEARATFERLGATPWLERLDAIAPSRVGA